MVSMSQQRTNSCAWCRGAQLSIGSKPSGIEFRRVLSSTGFAISAWCVACERPARPGYFEPHALFGDDECCAMQWLKVADDNRKPCSVCSEVSLLERHHLAPVEMFGQESERWPVVDVCRRCHERWHNVVDMYRRGE